MRRFPIFGSVLAGSGSNTLRVLRGGSYFNNTRNVRCSYRNRNNPNDRNDNIGFRVMLSTFFRNPALPGGSRDLLGRGEEWRSQIPAALALEAGRANRFAPPRAPRRRGGAFLRGGAVFDELTSWENLLLAHRQAALGKRGSRSVASFEHRLEDHLADLRAELIAGSYRPGPYRSFVIHEPKRRLISAAPFRDRVVHHALCNVIEPLFEQHFASASFANRVGKGTHRAVTRAQELAREHPFVLQLDLEQFFPSLDLGILRRRLEGRISDPRVLALVDAILVSGEGLLDDVYRMVYFPGDDLFAVNRPRGLPIGNLTSQFWANVYLDPLDQFVTNELGCAAWVRYVDDLLLFSNSKATLWRIKAAVLDKLDRLRLTAHPGAHPRPVTEGFPFLGFTLSPARRRLKRRKGFHFRRKLKADLAAWRTGAASGAQVAASVQGWLNHVRYGDTLGLQRELLECLPAPILARLAPLPGTWQRLSRLQQGGNRA